MTNKRAVRHSGLVDANKRRPISQRVVADAVKFVDGSGIPDQIAKWRQLDRGEPGPNGRPTVISDQAILALFLLLAVENSPLHLTRAAEIVTDRLSDESLALLGIDTTITGVDWYSCVWRTWTRFQDTLDAFPAPRNRYLDDTERCAVLEARDPVVCAEKLRRANWVANQFLHCTWQMLPREIRRRYKGNIAIDATPVVAHAKARTKRSPKTVEIDAAWYVREGDHRDPGDAAGKSMKKGLFGWEAHLAVATPNDTQDNQGFPLVVTAMSFDMPGFGPSENAMMLLESLHERGMPKGFVTTDRGYWPDMTAEDLQLPARALGWRNVNDYKDEFLGVTAHHEGAIQVEGHWYSEGMPDHLRRATIDYRVDKIIDEETWQERIAKRAAYLVKPKGRPLPNGDQRVMCPAAGKSPTVVCPLRKLSFETADAHTKQVATPPKTPMTLCQQGSMSIPAVVGAKYRQDIRFGTPEWHAHYATARNTIEGFNGFVKDGAYEALADGTRRRVRGRTAQHLMTAFLVTAANIRKIRAWVAAQPDDEEPVPTIKHRARRRKIPTLDRYLPEPNAPPGLTGTEN